MIVDPGMGFFSRLQSERIVRRTRRHRPHEACARPAVVGLSVPQVVPTAHHRTI
jgi:hypothetical protein